MTNITKILNEMTAMGLIDGDRSAYEYYLNLAFGIGYDEKRKKKRTRVIQYDRLGVEMNEFKSIMEAGRKTGLYQSGIIRVLDKDKPYRNYYFKTRKA